MAFTAHAAPSRFETVMPDNIIFCIGIDNMKTFYQNWQQHPASDISKKESVIRLLELLRKNEMPDGGKGEPEKGFSQLFEEEMGVKLERMPELFPGKWMIAVGEFDIQKYFDVDEKSSSDPSDLPFVQLMQHNGDVKAIRSMIDSSARYDSETEGTKHQIVEKSFRGETLLIEEVEDGGNITMVGGYAIIDDVLVMAESEEMLKETIIRLQNDNVDSFYKSERFAKVRDWVADKDAYVYVHFEKIIQALQNGAIKALQQKIAATKDQGGASQMTMFSPDLLLSALNLRMFDGFFLGLTLDTECSYLTSGLMLNGRKGLASLLQHEKGPLPHPAYVSSDVPSVRINQINLSDFFINLENLVTEAVPMVGGVYKGYLSHIKSQTGIDIRAGLINNLGSEIVTVDLIQTRQSPDQAVINLINTVYAVKIKDRQSFEMTINGIISSLGGTGRFEKSDYLGAAIYSLKTMTADGYPTQNNDFAYTITDDTFLFSKSSSEGLKTILSRMKKPTSKTLWDMKIVQRAIDELPTENVDFKYMDVDTITRILLDTLMMFLDEADLKTAGVNIEVLKKDIVFPYCLISQTYSEEDGIYNRAMLLKNEK
jgi:hypothetical protein